MIFRPRIPAVHNLAVPPVISSTVVRSCKPRCRHLEYLWHSQVQFRQPLSSTVKRQASNHYETLKVSPSVSKADLKKQFYVLSKETHPDRHPDDPKAGERFAELSEAYSVLGNDEKRHRYDRDVMRQQQGTRGGVSQRGGTYAGSRPATGLSKRRGTFRGPPPSFYAHGGGRESSMGAQQGQREGTSHQSSQYQAGTFNAGAYAEPGHWDPAFNPQPIYKTQTVEDHKRQSRRAAEMAAAHEYAEEEGNFWARFVIVTGVVFLGVSLGTLVVSSINSKPRNVGGLTRGDGSLRKERDGPRNTGL